MRTCTDYIRQLNAFWRWRELNDISHAQVDLYMALLDIFNRAFWAEELAIPNRAIMCKSEIADRKQLSVERQALCDMGLIAYTPKKSKQAGTYSLAALYTPEPQSDREAAPELPPIYKTENIINKTDTKTKLKGGADRVLEIFEAYNALCPNLPRAEKLTAERRRAIEERLLSFSAEEIKEAFEIADRSDFLTGAKKDWRAGLDWLTASDGNLLKVREGNYDNTDPAGDHRFTSMAGTGDAAEIERLFYDRYAIPDGGA